MLVWYTAHISVAGIEHQGVYISVYWSDINRAHFLWCEWNELWCVPRVWFSKAWMALCACSSKWHHRYVSRSLCAQNPCAKIDEYCVKAPLDSSVCACANTAGVRCGSLSCGILRRSQHAGMHAGMPRRVPIWQQAEEMCARQLDV